MVLAKRRSSELDWIVRREDPFLLPPSSQPSFLLPVSRSANHLSLHIAQNMCDITGVQC